MDGNRGNTEIHGIFQAAQYLADLSGTMIGMFGIGTLDGKPVHGMIDNFANRVKNIFKKDKDFIQPDKNIDQSTKDISNKLKIEDMQVDNNMDQGKKENIPAWDMRNYSEHVQEKMDKQAITMKNSNELVVDEENEDLDL